MKLSDYQWSRNPRGMHNQGVMILSKLIEQKMGIAKVVGLDAGFADFCRALIDRGITPIVRIYRPQHSGVPIDPEMLNQFSQYLQAGVKWFEIYNEPNLPIEWPPGQNFDPMNTAEVIAPICDNWLNWAEFILDQGGYPGFIPLSEAGGGWENITTWINQLCRYMADRHFNRFLGILNSGFWLATHPYILNHFYQEVPGGGPLSARPPEAQNYAEPGWHFEYPYDPICQESDPGRTVWGETPLVPLGDVHGLLGSGQAWLERLQDLFGVGAVPVIGTEGGLWPTPTPQGVQQLDIRYPGFTWGSHGHATQAMFDWISTQAPPWMFGVALWKWDLYYSPPSGGEMPAAAIFRDTSPILRNVPPVEAIGDFDLRILAERQTADQGPPPPLVIVDPPGPGRIHGEPDFHFVILAPGIDSEWFFEVATFYWERFQPTLMTVNDFINFLPKTVSLAATVITTPEQVDFMNRQIARRWTNVYMDMIVGSQPREIEELLNSRVAAGRRFG
jgi:hypothetical protein